MEEYTEIIPFVQCRPSPAPRNQPNCERACIWEWIFRIITVMVILGIETSCDETSAAVVTDGMVMSNIISSQLVHRQYGGIVPELASRAHQRLIVPVVKEALDVARIRPGEIGAVAVTYGPGLVGALLVGLNFAKGLSYGLSVPLIGVNHMEAHIYSSFLGQQQPEFPFLCLIVSGGHTQIVLAREPLRHELLGETLDDAAGEAYDKVAKMLGLGFPGGPVIDQLAAEGNPEYVRFPRSFLDEGSFDFSFSGIKTSVLYWLRDHDFHASGKVPEIAHQQLADLCASFQAAVVDVLVRKTLLAFERYRVRDVAVAGGVSANSELRARLSRHAAEKAFRLHLPALEYCTDNGAMIAMLGWMKASRGIRSDLELNAVANLAL